LSVLFCNEVICWGKSNSFRKGDLNPILVGVSEYM
jgi:hypothetical protein